MKSLMFLLLFMPQLATNEWLTDLERAKHLAKEKNGLILLNFSGSDWCGPCIRLRKEVFDNEAFQQLAEKSLILVNADFPRSKKNQLLKALQQNNESLADTYNPQGKFPFTLLLNSEGKVIRSWEGFPGNNSAQFIEQLKTVCDASR